MNLNLTNCHCEAEYSAEAISSQLNHSWQNPLSMEGGYSKV